MFKENLKEILNIGIGVNDLLESDIFCHQFDYDEWPQTSNDPSTFTVPYNDTKFSLRTKYEKHMGYKVDEDYQKAIMNESS